MAEFEPSYYRLMYVDQTRRNKKFLGWTGDCRLCDELKDDIRKLPVMPYRPSPRILKPKDYIEVWITTLNSDTIVEADSYVKIPITIKDKRTGTKRPSHLVLGQNSGEKYMTANPDGLVFTAGEERMLCYYQIEDGESMVLGHVIPFNSRPVIAPYDDTE